MNLDIAAVTGIPYSGCLPCDQVVVMGDSCAEDIAWAWDTHRKGAVHLAGGRPTTPPRLDPGQEVEEADVLVPDECPTGPYGPYGLML